MSWFGTDAEVILKLAAASECVWVLTGRKGLQSMETLWGTEWTFLHGDES